MAQYTNDAIIGTRWLTARGARSADVTGTVSRIDTGGIDTHRLRYGHRHARGADWYAENAREFARIDGGRANDADRRMLADGAQRAGVSVDAFRAALLSSPVGQSVPNGMDATAPTTHDATPTPNADDHGALLARVATPTTVTPKRRRR